jgi:hypothetical protein
LCSGIYDNNQPAILHLNYIFRYSNLDKENRFCSFIVPEVHVSSEDNIVVSQVSCFINNNQHPLKFNYPSYQDNIEKNSFSEISDHIIQELLIITKHIQVLT